MSTYADLQPVVKSILIAEFFVENLTSAPVFIPNLLRVVTGRVIGRHSLFDTFSRIRHGRTTIMCYVIVATTNIVRRCQTGAKATSKKKKRFQSRYFSDYRE